MAGGCGVGGAVSCPGQMDRRRKQLGLQLAGWREGGAAWGPALRDGQVPPGRRTHPAAGRAPWHRRAARGGPQVPEPV